MTLAESDDVSVRRCSCGQIHLQLGSLTLTMRPDDLRELGAVIQEAVSRLTHPAGARATTVN